MWAMRAWAIWVWPMWATLPCECGPCWCGPWGHAPCRRGFDLKGVVPRPLLRRFVTVLSETKYVAAEIFLEGQIYSNLPDVYPRNAYFWCAVSFESSFRTYDYKYHIWTSGSHLVVLKNEIKIVVNLFNHLKNSVFNWFLNNLYLKP